ncbi:7-deoxyloganetin glucosyltransferase-like [Canna indica]|uniref:Glycosyltransferase n=1 Tax=Canna indica TaxID=4628 RepID=A0AAQ3QGM3_9LILI|nr:7-deoxyloganetin glucosyltransferase-like [Canna indica]
MWIGDQKDRREMASTRTHVVCMPSPAQGHINAMLKFAKVLHSKGFFITFVNSEFNHNRVLKSKGPSALDGLPDFRFATIPDGLPPSDLDKNQSGPVLCTSMKKTCSAPFTKLLTALDDPSSGVPPVACVISDFICSFTLDATTAMAIPNIYFCSFSACGFMGVFYYKDLMERGIIPLKSEEDLRNGYLDTAIDWIPGMPKLRLKDLTSFLRTANQEDLMLNFFTGEGQASLQATAIIFNTFHELEAPVIEALSSMLPPIYDIGPLHLLPQHIPNGSFSPIGGVDLWRGDSSCMKWLDEKEPGSVLYVNFGSLIEITNEQFIEFAWGLANSGCEFLWVIRYDLVKGSAAVLPKEFCAETNGRRFITSWCVQEEVLSHAAIGGFLTHCGWNSTLESISAGVPMICWPFFADQQTNCKYVCSEWGIGVEIDADVKREEVAMLIKEVMEGEKGKKMKRKVLEWKEKAVEAAKPGGTSWKNLEMVIDKEIMKKKSTNVA